MENKKRYTVTIDMYVDAENDYMARKKAHAIKRSIENFNEYYIESTQTSVIGITETPFASLQTRELENISEISYKEDQDDLPF